MLSCTRHQASRKRIGAEASSVWIRFLELVTCLPGAVRAALGRGNLLLDGLVPAAMAPESLTAWVGEPAAYVQVFRH